MGAWLLLAIALPQDAGVAAVEEALRKLRDAMADPRVGIDEKAAAARSRGTDDPRPPQGAARRAMIRACMLVRNFSRSSRGTGLPSASSFSCAAA